MCIDKISMGIRPSSMEPRPTNILIPILPFHPQTTFQFQEWDSRRPHNTNPSLDFLAPEYILSKSCNEKSDVFSFGMLCYAVYNGGRPLCSSLNNLLSFKQNVETVSEREKILNSVGRILTACCKILAAFLGLAVVRCEYY